MGLLGTSFVLIKLARADSMGRAKTIITDHVWSMTEGYVTNVMYGIGTVTAYNKSNGVTSLYYFNVFSERTKIDPRIQIKTRPLPVKIIITDHVWSMTKVMFSQVSVC